MLVGYARVSTQDQNPDLQLDALKAALEYARAGDRFYFSRKIGYKKAFGRKWHDR